MALRKHDVEDVEHSCEPFRQRDIFRQVESHTLLAQPLLRPHDALRDSAFVARKGGRNLPCAQAESDVQHEPDLRRAGQHGVAAGKHQLQLIVTFECWRFCDDVRGGVELLGLTLSAQCIDQCVVCDADQPVLGAVGNPLTRPMLKSAQERVLRRVFRQRKRSTPKRRVSAATTRPWLARKRASSDATGSSGCGETVGLDGAHFHVTILQH